MRQFVICLAALALSGCGGGGVKIPTAAAPTATVAFRASIAPPPAQLQVAVNEYRPRLTATSGQASVLHSGNDHFAAVDVTLRNAGARDVSLSWAFGSLVDAQGRRYQDKGTDNMVPPDFPSTGTIAPGEQVRGWMAFQLPPDAAPVAFRYDAEIAGAAKLP
jgi:hypothetical protein